MNIIVNLQGVELRIVTWSLELLGLFLFKFVG